MENFKDRIHPGAVAMGTLLTVAGMFFLSESIRNLFSVLRGDGAGFSAGTYWATLTGVWVISVFLGSALAAYSARLTERSSAALQGISVWAASYLLLGFLLSSSAGGFGEPIAEFGDVSDWLVLKDIFGECAAIAAGLMGGQAVVRFKRSKKENENVENVDERGLGPRIAWDFGLRHQAGRPEFGP